MYRATHLSVDGDPKILNDRFAHAFADIPDDDERGINSDRHRQPFLRPLRAFMVLRPRYVEDELAVHFAHREAQYVVLGAGLDSFAFRKPASLQHLRVFEIDHPDTQTWKRERLHSLGMDLPSDVTLVPVDFEQEQFSAKLSQYGFQSELPTLFSWLGVIYYLTRDAFDATVAEALQCAPVYCQLIMDFVLPVEILSPYDQAEVRRVSTNTAKVGEPWVSYYAPDELRQVLVEAGFKTVDHCSPEAATDRYFIGRTDGLYLSGAYHLMNARRGKV